MYSKYAIIAVAGTKISTKPTSVTSYKFVIFASYKFKIIAVARTTNTKHTSVTSSKFVINTSVTSSKFVTFAMNKYKYTSIVCSKGFHYWMVFTLGVHETLPPSLATSALPGVTLHLVEEQIVQLVLLLP